MGAAAVSRVSVPPVLASPAPGISGGFALPARAGERGPLGEAGSVSRLGLGGEAVSWRGRPAERRRSRGPAESTLPDRF